MEVMHGIMVRFLGNALCGIYLEKLAKKSKMYLKKFKKLSMQYNRQQNSALYIEFSRLYVEICRFEMMSEFLIFF